MKELAKIFGISSIILLSILLTGPGSEFLWGTLKPLSTLFLIAFFITNFLAEEYANYDEKQNYRLEWARSFWCRRGEKLLPAQRCPDQTIAERNPPVGPVAYDVQTHKV